MIPIALKVALTSFWIGFMLLIVAATVEGGFKRRPEADLYGYAGLTFIGVSVVVTICYCIYSLWRNY